MSWSENVYIYIMRDIMMCKNDERMKYNYVMNEEEGDGEGEGWYHHLH